MLNLVIYISTFFLISYLLRKASVNFCKGITTDVFENLSVSLHDKLSEEITDHATQQRCLLFLEEEIQKKTAIAIREMNREQTLFGAGKPWEGKV